MHNAFFHAGRLPFFGGNYMYIRIYHYRFNLKCQNAICKDGVLNQFYSYLGDCTKIVWDTDPVDLPLIRSCGCVRAGTCSSRRRPSRHG